MAYATMTMTNGVETKQVPLGYSWTMFFWGCIPAFMRQDWLWAVGLLGSCFLVGPLATIVCSFIYNKAYAKGLFEKGYKVSQLPAGYTEDHVKAYLGYSTLAMA